MSRLASPPRVTLFISGLDGGGAERVILNLGRGLVGRGVAVDLVLVYPSGPYAAQLDPAIRVVQLGARRLLGALPHLVRYLRRERPTALLAALEDNNLLALLARPLARRGTRTVVTVHNHLSVEARHAPGLRQRLAPRAAGLLYRFADAVVAVSDGVARDLVTLGVPAALTRVIHNPIYADTLLERSREPIDHPWLAPGAPPVIVGVGRLTPQKDFATLLAALARVRRLCPARLVLLGDGPERDRLAAQARALELGDAVAFAGFVANPYAWMARARVLALSSVYEGFGNVLVEALAVGTPVVATDCPSGPAEILEGGRHGRLVPPGDPAALAQAILATLAAPVDPARLRARAARFSLDRAVDAYLPLLGLGGATAEPAARPGGQPRLAGAGADE